MRTLLLTWLLAVVSMALFQQKLVWYPGPPPTHLPPLRPPLRDLTLRTADGVALNAWWIEASPSHGAIVHCHGNAGSISGRIAVARALRSMGWSTLLFDYRGYGKSEGHPTEEGTYLDAEAAYDWVRSEGVAPERIVAWGESLGGGVAVELARRRPLAALITESTFTSIPDVGAQRFPWLPVRLLARIHYDNAAKAAELKLPWLLLHGRDDRLVPIDHAQRLFAIAQAARASSPPAAPLLFHPVAGGHEALRLGDVAADSAVVARFLAASAPPR